MKRTAAIFFLILFCGIVRADEPAVDAARFLNDLKNSSPVLYERLAAEKDLLPRMMQSIVPGLAAAPETPSPQPEKQRLYPARLLYGNTIFYTRLDRIDEESLQNLMEEMRTTARLASRPVGAILDLRSA
ncbi:MAG: hypothetical protein J6Q65_05505, partial [Lentisphaeria bacterium]|nr:hypothetical protein [Lentisphaeria bacterium]